MSIYKIHRKANGSIGGYGPDDDQYQPVLGVGDMLEYTNILPPPSLEAQLAAIEAEYSTKFAALDTSLLAALWAGGTNEVANRQALSAKRQQLTADKTAAITNVFLNG